jgi:hypothetical protein
MEVALEKNQKMREKALLCPESVHIWQRRTACGRKK